MNIFKSIIRDRLCKYLTACSYGSARYERERDRNIVKHCLTSNVYENEVNMYLSLLDYNITVPASAENGLTIKYYVNGYVNLHDYILKLSATSLTILYHELFSFVSTLHRSKIYHGNLSVHTIFVDTSNKMKPRFLLIDLSKSRMNHVDSADFDSLYRSIKIMHKTAPKGLKLLNKVTAKYGTIINNSMGLGR